MPLSDILFYLKKLITPFMLPPGIFILLLLVSGVWLLGKGRRSLGWFQIFIAAAMWIAALGPVAGLLYSRLESEFLGISEFDGDVIVLLGGGIDDAAPDLGGIGIPSQEMLERIVAAARLHKRINVPVIASGGGYFHQRISEAEVTRRYLMELGVPERMIHLEPKSRDTRENARFTKAVCQRFGYRNPVLLTSAFHLKRAVLSFRKEGMQVVPFPAGIRSAPDDFVWTDILPTDYQGISSALKEYLGYVVYRYLY